MPPLSVEASVEPLRSSLHESGVIPASPVHEVYQFGWLRDGSWCAYALDVTGHRDAASRWHHWVARTVLKHEHRVEEALSAVRAGQVNGRVMMPARFTLGGDEEDLAGAEEWPNFQTDCYGFWLWSLADHVRRGGGFDEELERAARLVTPYLMAAAAVPCCVSEAEVCVATSATRSTVEASGSFWLRLGDGARARPISASSLSRCSTGSSVQPTRTATYPSR